MNGIKPLSLAKSVDKPSEVLVTYPLLLRCATGALEVFIDWLALAFMAKLQELGRSIVIAVPRWPPVMANAPMMLLWLPSTPTRSNALAIPAYISFGLVVVNIPAESPTIKSEWLF